MLQLHLQLNILSGGNKMKSLYRFGIFLGLSILLFFSGCIQQRQPKIPQYNTGMKKTKKWLEYNKWAKNNNAPILDFAATTLKYKFRTGSRVLNYDFFTKDDIRVVIETKWHNCKVSDIYEFKFYMPDGRLFNYEYFIPKKQYKKWTIGRKIFIKDIYNPNMNGKWKVEIYANNKLAAIKYFVIEKDVQIKQANPKINIAIFPYLDNQRLSSWKHRISLPSYLSWNLLLNNKNINIIPVKLIDRNLENLEITYDTFEEYVKNDLNSNESIIKKLLNKYKIDYIVLGKVLSGYFGGISYDTTVTNYIIDVKKRKIVKKFIVKHSFYRSDFNIVTRQKAPGIHPMKIEVYEKVYKKLNSNFFYY